MSAALDTAAVERWLGETVPGFRGPLTAEKIPGGQSNPTYRLEAPSGGMVLRRKPSGTLLKSAHAVDREFRVQRALADTAVPVPRMIALCEDEGVIGTMFYVMERVEGRHFDDPRLPGLAPAERAAIFETMARTLGAIHTVDADAAGLGDYGPPGDYYARQIDRWTQQYRASETEEVPAMDDLIAWLGASRPEDDGRRALVHGDYRVDNMIFDAGAPRCAAVLDWELSTLGHPFADLAYVLMQWRMPPGGEGRGLAGVDRAALGLPSDEAFVAAYTDAAGIAEIPPLNFYLAFAFFRMAAILQGVKRRALDGNASDPERGLRMGAHVPRLAEGGLRAAEHG